MIPVLVEQRTLPDIRYSLYEELAEVGLDVNDRFEFMLRTRGYCGNNNLYIGKTPTDITTDKRFL